METVWWQICAFLGGILAGLIVGWIASEIYWWWRYGR